MKTFVVRLNPDTRKGAYYSKYPTLEEYESIHESAPMNGFHEAVNFLSEDGVVRGYLPPKHLRLMRTGEPFILITITAKTAKIGGDMVVGIQVGCRYESAKTRLGGTKASRSLDLYWHYSCPESMSLLFVQQIPDARELVLGANSVWIRGPTFEIEKVALQRILSAGRELYSTEEIKLKLQRITEYINSRLHKNYLEITVDSEFDSQVTNALEGDLFKVIGNKSPNQIESLSYRYQRCPAVVAYALRKANGICGDCKHPAPFVSSQTGRPYLEVHHVKMLKNGGSDTIENVIALCPNCHRKRHHG